MQLTPQRFAARALLIAALAAACPRIAAAHGDVNEPIAALTRAIHSRPGDAGLYLARAELRRLGGDLGRAAADLDAASRLAPGHPALGLCRAAVALDGGDAAGARRELDRALAEHAGDPRLRVLRARAAAELGDLVASVSDYTLALRSLSAPPVDLVLERARQQIRLGDRDGALAGIDEAGARLGPIVPLVLFAVDVELAAGRPEAAAHRLDALAPQIANPAALAGVRARIASGTPGGAAAAASAIPGRPTSLTSGLATLTAAARRTLDAEPAGVSQALATVTRGPYLQMGIASAITVRWRTDTATDSWVRYGTDPAALTAAASDAASVTEHELRLTGLAPDTRYYYSVGTAAGAIAGDASYTFVTAPPTGPAHATRVWIVGDSGLPTAGALAVRDAYAAWTGARGTDLWLMLGDNAYDVGTDAQYQAGCFDLYPVMLRQAVLWPTRGNHDVLYGGPNNDYYDLFTIPVSAEAGGLASGTEAWYSFDRANVHFVCLDSEGSPRTPGGAMLTWLASDLAANTRPWVIAFWHHPPYTKGSHDSDDPSDSGGRMADMRANALPILEAGGVDLVLSGHSHGYERTMLLDGHYGLSSTLTPAMKKDAGDGRPGGGGPYDKPSPGPAPHEGAVYAVAGSSAKSDGGPMNHPAMIQSIADFGSMVLDIAGSHLEARFLDDAGAVRDSFVIDKSAPVSVPATAAVGPRLGPGLPSPFALDTRIAYTVARAGHVRLTVVGADGRRLATLVDGRVEAGTHEARWDGCDASGRAIAAGVYLAVLETGGERVSRKIALVH